MRETTTSHILTCGKSEVAITILINIQSCDSHYYYYYYILGDAANLYTQIKTDTAMDTMSHTPRTTTIILIFLSQ